MNAQQIAAFRRKHYHSQAALAKELGLSQVAISHWESGRRKPSGPALRLLTQMAQKKRSAKNVATSR